MRHYFPFRLFEEFIDKVLWEVFGWSNFVVLWRVSVPLYSLLPMTAITYVLHIMRNSLLQELTSLIVCWPKLVISFCVVHVGGVLWYGLLIVVDHFLVWLPTFWALTNCSMKMSCWVFSPGRLLRCVMASRWRDKIQGRVKVIWSTLSRLFCLWAMSTAVRSLHKLDDQQQTVSFPTIARPGASFGAVQPLSFACWHCASFQIDRMNSSSEALFAGLWTWC